MSVNNVTVLYLLPALHRRISVSDIIKIPKLRRRIKQVYLLSFTSIKRRDCLLSRSGLFII